MDYGNASKNNLIWENSNKYFDDSYEIDENNPNASYSLLSKNVEPRSTVLDVGCNDGKWGRLLKKRNCICYGVDIDKEAVECLEKQGIYKEIKLCNVENDFNQIFSWNIKFDYIGCFDILEHTVNPTKVLESLLSVLKDNGNILISIPNVGNADIFLNLLCGRFNYNKTGILDNTHTKFFTKKSFAQWIDSINSMSNEYVLDCKYIGGTYGYTEYLNKIKKVMPNLYSLIQLNSQFNVIQLLFVLTKKTKDAKLQFLPQLLKEPDFDVLLEALETDFVQNPLFKRALTQNNISNNEREDYLKQSKYLSQQIVELNQQNTNFKNEIDNLNEQLNIANKNWAQCALELDQANRAWIQSAEQLKQGNECWTQCSEQLKDALRNWGECAQSLYEANNVLQAQEKKLNDQEVYLKEVKEKLITLQMLLEEEKQDYFNLNEEYLSVKQELMNIKDSKVWRLLKRFL
ncbi:MAG: methyltransferase domain-containing protein [Clostridiales bacterium]|nr:methyltransferase domain-containing protein [Clostridiales bacterium]